MVGVTGGQVTEILEPVADGLIRRCLEAGDWGQQKALWHRLLDYAAGEGGPFPDPTSPSLPRVALSQSKGQLVYRSVAAPTRVSAEAGVTYVYDVDKRATRDHLQGSDA